MPVHHKQPTSVSCGQTCVAMLLGVQPEAVIRHVQGGKHGTTAKQLCQFLEQHGWKTSGRCRIFRMHNVLPPIALCRVRWGDRKYGAHWVLWAEGRWWDPLRDREEHPALHTMKPGGRVLSYVTVERVRVTWNGGHCHQVAE